MNSPDFRAMGFPPVGSVRRIMWSRGKGGRNGFADDIEVMGYTWKHGQWLAIIQPARVPGGASPRYRNCRAREYTVPCELVQNGIPPVRMRRIMGFEHTVEKLKALLDRATKALEAEKRSPEHHVPRPVANPESKEEKDK